MIPYGRQTISEADIAAVCDALRSDFLTTGPLVEQFETRFAEFVGARYAVAVSNATAALHLAMLAAGLNQGHRVVTSPNTFLASANCAAFVGATPDFCDIDPVSYNMCPRRLADTWREDTAAVVAVDYAGQTAEMPEIARVAREHGALVIEDACHAVGGRFSYEDRIWSVGGHPWADITTFSFHPVKTLTTGEGGMLVTDDETIAHKARRLRNHGMVREPSEFTGLASTDLDERGPWYYEMQALGWNYRLTDLQCALGLSQLDRLREFLQRRREIVARYNAAFRDLPLLECPQLRTDADRDLTSWHLYTVQIDFDALGMTRTEFMQRLRSKGIGSQVLYIPVHLQPWYQQTFGYRAGKCPVAESYYRRTLSLPLYPAMTDEDVSAVTQAVKELLGCPAAT